MVVTFYSKRRATANPSRHDLVTCTIGTELLPDVDPTTGMQENAVTFDGLSAGVDLMLALQIFLPEYDYGRKPLGRGENCC